MNIYFKPIILIVFMLLATSPKLKAEILNYEAKQDDPTSSLVGEFEGFLLQNGRDERNNVGLQVSRNDDGTYRAVLYYGGVPDDNESQDVDKVELQGTFKDEFTFRLKGNSYRFQFIYGRYTALDQNNSYRGHLTRVIRTPAVAQD